MGNLNFQDDPDENREKDQNPNQNQNQDSNQGPDQDANQDQNLNFDQPDLPEQDEPRIDEGFIDDPTAGSSKVLWIAIIVVVLAGIGGALYMLNRSGYLKLPLPGKKKPAVTTTTTRTTPPPPVASAPAAKHQKPAPVAKKPVAQRPAAKQTGNFSLQVSAFKTRAQADRYISSLRKKGVEGRVIVGQGAKGEKWYRVVSGNYGTRLKAIAEVHSMKKKVGTDVWVVPAQ